MIRQIFLSCIFFGKTKTISPIVGALSTVLFKKSELGLLNPVTSSQEKYLRSIQGSKELVWAVTGVGTFSNANHLRILSEERRDGKKDQDVAHESRPKGLVHNIKDTAKHLLLRAKITGAWLSGRGTTVSGTVLSATEFRCFSMCLL